MRGYPVKKGNSWYAVIYEGTNPATGKDKRSWHKAGPRKKDAERLVTDLVKRRNDGEQLSPEKITIATYLTERWLPIQEAQLRPSTYDSYRRNIELHVVPGLGQLQLRKLEADDLDVFYARLLKKGQSKKGKRGGLSVKTVRNIHLMIHKALADAQRKGVVFRNVASLADAPKLSSQRRPEMKVWTAEQLRRFLEVAEERRHYPAFFLAAHTGMRRGEILGLRWNDVDLSTRRLSIRTTVINVAYEIQRSDAKTDGSRRTIDLDRRTIDVLRQWKKDQPTEDVTTEARTTWGDLVFAKPDGTPIHPDIFSQAFERIVTAAKLPAIRLHDLRHTHATLLLKAGVPVKVVSERLGHANAAFTMNVYQHVIPGMQAEAADTFSRLLHDEEGTDNSINNPDEEPPEPIGARTPAA